MPNRKKSVLILCGGGGAEHDISLISAQFIQSQLSPSKFEVISLIIDADGTWKDASGTIYRLLGQDLFDNQHTLICRIDCVIPCVHGTPGESGELAAKFEIEKAPFFGCHAEANLLCYNKIATKLLLEKNSIKTAPFLMTQDKFVTPKIKEFFKLPPEGLFVKSSHQGCSIGCTKVEDLDLIDSALDLALQHSPYALIEKPIQARELEIALFEYAGQMKISHPGEIITPHNQFYDYQQKYSEQSQTKVVTKAKGLSQDQVKAMTKLAQDIAKLFRIKDLSRLDLFLTNHGEIYVNEINTFPGMTSISLFPALVEDSGISFKAYIESRIEENIIKSHGIH